MDLDNNNFRKFWENKTTKQIEKELAKLEENLLNRFHENRLETKRVEEIVKADGESSELTYRIITLAFERVEIMEDLLSLRREIKHNG